MLVHPALSLGVPPPRIQRFNGMAIQRPTVSLRDIREIGPPTSHPKLLDNLIGPSGAPETKQRQELALASALLHAILKTTKLTS